ncbi:DNA replication protein psf2 [Claviceps pusilla]|uniref:DNA replication complex GINS protein PSF2 n=1 Tax=Claviceps pusilla TaxID=123648 RepID=A0A9P7NIV4_9HYPO|nr:DNA replication protein psf2 [Claviceps lovelessii]KAG6017887.1 DNA replication protein psf2 [Claviceps pusilla]
MALSLPPGLLPSEVAFLCEMELVTIVPRQKLESINLLSGPTPQLRPPRRSDVPLWLALLLKKQRRANIVPPPWLHPDSLRDVIRHETKIDTKGWAPPPPPPSRAADSRGNARRINDDAFSGHHRDTVLSPPFLPSCTAEAPSGHLPYHWFEMAEMLLAHAGDDIVSASEVRSLLRDLQEVRAAKMRSSTAQLENGVDGVMSLRGVGAMELAESRGFVTGVVDGVRKIGASGEASRREEEERAGVDDEPSDDDMGL